MEDSKKLYPLRFISIPESFAWSGDSPAESHEIADLGYRDSQIKDGWLAGNTLSEVMDMYIDRIVGTNVYEHTGRQFPVSVKIINAKERMPLVVCPADEMAVERYDFLGKKKLWYILEAGQQAEINLGFKRNVTAAEVYGKCIDGTIGDLLKIIRPSKGDWYAVEPGTVHSACGGVKILEISEASPMDFCLSGFGKPVPEDEFDPSLNIMEAMDFIDLKPYSPGINLSGLKALGESKDKGPATKLCSSHQFTVSKLDLHDPLHITGEEDGSFVIYTCVSGEASVQVPLGESPEAGMEPYNIKAGETLLVPAEISDFYLVPQEMGTVVLETMIENYVDQDPYIDPSVPAKLDVDSDDSDSGDDDQYLNLGPLNQ